METILNAQPPPLSLPIKVRAPPSIVPTLPFKIQHLTLKEMDDRKHKGLCYNYDEKFVKNHKWKEHKLFHMDMQEPHTTEEVTH